MSTKRLVKLADVLFVAILAVLVISGTIALATQTNLPKGFIIGDSYGVYVETDGKYLIHVDNISPGDVITRTLTIRNLERRKTPITLNMMAEPEQVSGPVNLLDTMTLSISMDGHTLYHGKMRGDEGNNMVQNALPLGIYAQGDSKTLHIRIEAGYWEQSAEVSVAEISWYFYAGKGPNICGFAHYWLYAVVILIGLIILTLLLLRKKRREQN